ncbi:hypothetical protein Y032_0183g909 [Ancylostoma ceylanicum]|uniref:Uncharacterized protein n=1 Tax=Ancylostoma ceylanicum TaxID=53326 RepID=A0A016SSK3_9BILA|nr:hypothetical protein Y032_0183g909 [Ancylostoma ceylanicum]
MIHLVVSFFHGALVNRWALDSGVDVDGSHAAWRKKCSTFESGTGIHETVTKQADEDYRDWSLYRLRNAKRPRK